MECTWSTGKNESTVWAKVETSSYQLLSQIFSVKVFYPLHLTKLTETTALTQKSVCTCCLTGKVRHSLQVNHSEQWKTQSILSNPKNQNQKMEPRELRCIWLNAGQAFRTRDSQREMELEQDSWPHTPPETKPASGSAAD